MNKSMQHKLQIGISDKSINGNAIVRCRKIALRERIMRWLFGELRRVTIIVPGDTVRDITIQETTEGVQ